MAGTMYEGGPLRMAGHATERINWLTDTIMAALSKVTGGEYSPSNQTEVSYTTIATAMEVANGDGYATGGKQITSTTLAYETDTYRYLRFDANDPAAWTASTFDTRGSCIYDTTATNKPTICWLDFGSVKSVTSGTLTVVFDTSHGLFRHKVV